MICKADIRKNLENYQGDIIRYDKEKQEVIYINDGFVVTLDEFVENMRRVHHCDFEEIYYCHATLDSVLKCRQCGTIIFASDDIMEYDKGLCCPTCGDYKTHFDYWTKEEIEQDITKQYEIDMMLADMKNNERLNKIEKEKWEKYGEHRRYEERWKIKIKLDKICKKLGFKNLSRIDIIWVDDKDKYIFWDEVKRKYAEKKFCEFKSVNKGRKVYVDIRVWGGKGKDKIKKLVIPVSKESRLEYRERNNRNNRNNRKNSCRKGLE